MATRSNPGKQRRGNRAATQTERVSEDESLAEDLLRAARQEQAEFVAGWTKFMKQLGVRGKPIGGKKLRARLLKKGIDPDGNEFSQGIIAMREE